ncbi:MAG: M20 family metallo-hydrolase [Candidatus Korarchaeota archaeon]
MTQDPVVKNALKWIEESNNWIVSFYKEFIPIKAISPSKGENGELNRAIFFEKKLGEWGFPTLRYDARDEKGFTRPNLVVSIPGRTNRRLWIVVHLDTVSISREDAWIIKDPFEPELIGERIYGRGVEDNGQSIVASLLALRALKKHGITPYYSINIALVSDEEEGSKYGIQHLINLGLFNKEDMVIVPDWGSPDGMKIEIAEKGIYWIKVTVNGKASHGSLPHKGINAHRLAAKMITVVDSRFREIFCEKNEIFEPPFSTLEPTRCLENQNDINTVPGRHVFFYDARILPPRDKADLDTLFHSVSKQLKEESSFPESIIIPDPLVTWEYVECMTAAPPTPADAPVVKLLAHTLSSLRGKSPSLVGIGGGTCASYFRKAGIPAVAWSTIEETAHSTNENVLLGNVINDAKVFLMCMIPRSDY